uniref:Uncharacterized protein n=1 Tax=Oryzias sinensis TaxID=183150 RepID=A0A8C7YB67_9TELE
GLCFRVPPTRAPQLQTRPLRTFTLLSSSRPLALKAPRQSQNMIENTAYAKKMVLRLAGLMGLGGAVSIVYIFGECCQSKSELFSVMSFTNATTCRIPLPAPRFGLFLKNTLQRNFDSKPAEQCLKYIN